MHEDLNVAFPCMHLRFRPKNNNDMEIRSRQPSMATAKSLFRAAV